MDIQKTGFLWDLDGTIIDSYDLHFESWRQALLTVNIKLTHCKFLESFGRNNRISLTNYLGFVPEEHLYLTITELKENIFRKEVATQAKPFPGVINWLSSFKQIGISQVIASSAPMINIEAILTAFNLESYFDAVIPGANLPSKPAPDIFLKAAEAIEREPKCCVVFEDSTAGLQAGKAAGMKTIGLVTTQLKETISADIILDNFNTTPEKFYKNITKLFKGKNSL